MVDVVPKLNQFENVRIIGPNLGFSTKAVGVVVWGSGQNREPTETVYSVYIPSEGRHETCRESDLVSLGCFDGPTNHIGTRHEISFDLVWESDMDFVEGTFRAPGRFWEVLIVAKKDVPVPELTWEHWGQIRGLVLGVPKSVQLSREYVINMLSEIFAPQEWVEVRGPDSMILRS